MTKAQAIDIRDRLNELLSDAQKSAEEFKESLDKSEPNKYHGFEADAYQVGYLTEGIKVIIGVIENVAAIKKSNKGEENG